jgi:hypothetical protein
MMHLIWRLLVELEDRPQPADVVDEGRGEGERPSAIGLAAVPVSVQAYLSNLVRDTMSSLAAR